VFGDIKKGNGDAALAQFGAKVTPNAHALANAYGLFDNFYDQGTLSADGHNWLVQADANDYIEKEFGAFYRSYPAQGGDALAYQRDGFIWNAAQAAGKSVKVFSEYNNFISEPAGSTWSAYYTDSQILEGKASGPYPVPPSAVYSYADIPSLNAVDYHPYPAFDLYIPDQYRADIWAQSFKKSEQTGSLANLNLIWPAQVGVPAAVRQIYLDWVVWSRNGHFTGPKALVDYANPAQLNRLDWYSAHNWKVPYPGDRKILAPSQVPGAQLPAGYLGD
jgi:hypothetical protein